MAAQHDERPSDTRRVFTGLQETAELFQLLVTQIKDYAIFVLDTDGRIASWNDGAELLKGYGPQEIIGQHFERFYTDDDRKAGKPQLMLEKAKKNGRVEDEGWRVRKDGSRFWADVVITALYDKTAKLRGFAKVTRDLTGRKQTEESLQEARESLEQRVQKRTAELEQALTELRERNEELEQFADAVVGRELKMIELEKEIARLQQSNPAKA
ncbi:MAG TPA: PAS domain-containing protein [Nitrospiraceae bacterium]|nr:PAS domain-containing protein [Nitrospiraceae bacterium]